MKLLLVSRINKSMVIWFMCLLLAALLSINNVSSASTSVATSAAPQPSHSLQSVQFRTLVASALAKVAQIRAQVRHGNTSHLEDYITQLNALVALIDAARPTGEIDALVTYYQQHLDFEDNKQVLADILPLYHALDVLPPSKQTTTARQQLNNVRAALQNGKRADALEALDNMRRTLSNDGVDFPLHAAEEKLHTITSHYKENNDLQQSSTLLGLETDFLQILSSL